MQIEERRYCKTEIRSDAANQKKVLSGLAARFNHLSEDLGGFRERLAPGCFAASLASTKDIAMLADHDSSKVLGRRSNGTLHLAEDGTGLRFRCELNDAVSHARDIYEMCKRGDVKECSFGFRCEDEDWNDEDDPDDRSRRARRVPVRLVKRANLFEVSAVTFPAYAGNATSVTAALADGPIALMAARNLFPRGIPAEIRSRIPGIGIIDPAEQELLARARSFLTRIAMRD